MDIHHLKIFYETCNEKSFTKAAKKLFISQSAVSIQLKKFELSLSTQLIERNSKSFKLTFAGNELYKMSQDIFNKISRMENQMKKIVSNHNAKIVVGATHNIGEPLLPKIITDYSKKYKEIEFDIYIKNSASLIKHIKDGIIDIAMMEEEVVDEKELKFVQTDNYPFVVIAPPYINKLEDIKEMSMLKKDTQLASKYIENFEEIIDHTFERKISVNGSNETIKNLVMNGMGISVLPYYCVYEEIKEKKMNLVHEFDKLEDKFQLVYLKENENKIWIANFVEFFKQYNIKFEADSIIKKK
ncbi:LysR family transcriptional regulator [Streptobacillus moniliformis]|uniref:Transcriptional regulator, LysR family n=1 Tax=Streptobacillus moniliformis (strain ATCC 14647 / DSM 12112 / NCTC 10651 / 9901) TaxID=519441 RepID=D1AXC9_STRM9|nr:LysR family transcriptional regulator [Streptobacillus moniliformis]ACZ00955.1 transcriptional regulator, LysR family [Streptobacillus moniliformis DSM 12112]AVL42666.1 LysR family transcriptional regulator [Streptobacillus moniliformis]